MLSLVTACMNREEHLRQTLPGWLKLPHLTEILVVDWSNNRPLLDLCSVDTRVRVVRVEDETKWVLSYAYNIGLRHATGPNIIKCDADCMPSAEVAAAVPGRGHFFAGFWKSGAAVGKPSVNGQCVFSKSQFDAVNGYSELIRTYGRDDEDFYDRMIAAGFERREISVDRLDFIDHSQEARVSNQFSAAAVPSVAERIARDPLYNEMRNFFVARQLPWHRLRPQAGYTTVDTGERWTVLRRIKSDEIAIPTEVAQAARLYALRYIVAQLTKSPQAAVARLDERACLAVIGPRITTGKP